MKKIPVILDTDIGTDIDDTWALAFLLKCPELEVKLITTTTGDTFTRAKVVAKILELVGRTDIPIGIGIPLEPSPCNQSAWVKDYDLETYPGQILSNGIGAFIDTIQRSPEPITILGIGPLPNIAAALMIEPAITSNSRFIGMFGSIRRGYFGKDEVAAEYNVKLYPHACKKVFSASWEKIIVPLDTCGILQLKGDIYKTLRQSEDVLIKAVMENYDCWTLYNRHPLYNGFDPETESSVLYDLLPIYLAFSESFVGLEPLKLTVTEDGYTTIDECGHTMRCATFWQDLPAFMEFMVSRLSS